MKTTRRSPSSDVPPNQCEACGSQQVYVLRTKAQLGEIRRHRVCKACGHRFDTTERRSDKPSIPRWSPEELEFLQAEAGRMSPQRLVAEIQARWPLRSESAIKHQAWRLGISLAGSQARA